MNVAGLDVVAARVQQTNKVEQSFSRNESRTVKAE
jgi:hypothetical protein